MWVDPGHGGPREISGGFVNCPHCACPNREDDVLCSFCKAPLRSKPGVIQRVRLTVEQMKWRRKSVYLRKKKVVIKKDGHPAIAFIIGIVILASGWVFFINALGASSFSDFLIGVLFLMYGGHMAWNLFRKQR